MTDIEPVKVEVPSGRIGELSLEEKKFKRGKKKEEQLLMEDKAKHGKLKGKIYTVRKGIKIRQNRCVGSKLPGSGGT